MTVILVLVFILASLVEGVRDGFMYHYRSIAGDDKYNIHGLFSLERAIIILSLSYIFYLKATNYQTILFVSSLMLMFSFFHNGAYYTTRHFLNKAIYPKTFFDDSTTSTATFEFTITTRVIFAVMGVACVIYILAT